MTKYNVFYITELTKFFQIHDERHEDYFKKTKKLSAMKKQRIIGAEIEGLIPSNAPSWTLKPQLV